MNGDLKQYDVALYAIRPVIMCHMIQRRVVMTVQAIMAATRMKTTRAERILMNFSNELSCVKSWRDIGRGRVLLFR